VGTREEVNLDRTQTLELDPVHAAAPGPDRPRTSASPPLVRIALALAASGAFHALLVPQTPGRLGLPTAELIPELPLWRLAQRLRFPLLEDGLVVGALLLATGLGAFAALGIAVRLAWGRPADRRSLWTVFAAAFLLVAISLWSLPSANTDIFNYIMRGRIAAVYHENPYFVAADEFSDDPIHRYAGHRYTAHPGGKFPTWMLINVSLAGLAGDDPVRNLMLYRSVLALFTIGSVALVAMTLRRLSPAHVLGGTILFGWCPIVTGYGPHKSDSVMVFFLLLGAYLLARDRTALGYVALALSCFVKLVTFPLVVILLARRLLERRWTEVLIAVALFAATAALLYAPFGGFDLMTNHFLFVQSKSGAGAPDTWQPILRCAGLAAAAWAVLRRPRGLDGTLAVWAVVMFCLSAFLMHLAFSWYLMTLFAVASIAKSGRIAAATLALGTASFVANVWSATSSPDFPLATLSPLSPQTTVFLACAVVAGAAVALRARRGRTNPGGAA
jgi:hypothetical protein